VFDAFIVPVFQDPAHIAEDHVSGNITVMKLSEYHGLIIAVDKDGVMDEKTARAKTNNPVIQHGITKQVDVGLRRSRDYQKN